MSLTYFKFWSNFKKVSQSYALFSKNCKKIKIKKMSQYFWISVDLNCKGRPQTPLHTMAHKLKTRILLKQGISEEKLFLGLFLPKYNKYGFFFKIWFCYFFPIINQSSPFNVCDCKHKHQTHITSLLCVKNSTQNFCLWQLWSGTLEQRK